MLSDWQQSCVKWKNLKLDTDSKNNFNYYLFSRKSPELTISLQHRDTDKWKRERGRIYESLKYLTIYSFNGGNYMADLPIAAVVRIAKKNGAERVGSDAAEALVAKAEAYIAELTKKANQYALHAGRKTIKEEDIELAAKSEA